MLQSHELKTHWGTMLYYDEARQALRHAPASTVPPGPSLRVDGGVLFVLDGTRNTPQTLHGRRICDVLRRDDHVLMHVGYKFASARAGGAVTFEANEAALPERFTIERLNVATLSHADALTVFGRFVSGRPPLKLYWWRPSFGVNFGDEINPYIVRAVSGREVVWSPVGSADLLAIGSVLGNAPDNDPDRVIHVWGSGVMELHGISNHRYKYSALRGPLTAECLELTDGVPYGDPGLLASWLWQKAEHKKYRWGIIPHHSQSGTQNFLDLAAKTTDSILIDVLDHDIESVARTISECEFIATSSLHGLIVADSYRVPSLWIDAGALHAGWNVKFYDYFLSISRQTPRKLRFESGIDLRGFEHVTEDRAHFAHIEKAQKTLIDSFPNELKGPRARFQSR